MTLKLSELEQLKLTNPVSKKWMYTAIRHCQRNEDFDIDMDDGEEPDRYEGEAMADALNAFPALISWAKRARAYLEKELPHAKSSLERFESTLGHNKVAQETVIPRLKKDIAELEQLLGECGE